MATDNIPPPPLDFTMLMELMMVTSLDLCCDGPQLWVCVDETVGLQLSLLFIDTLH